MGERPHDNADVPRSDGIRSLLTGRAARIAMMGALIAVAPTPARSGQLRLRTAFSARAGTRITAPPPRHAATDTASNAAAPGDSADVVAVVQRFRSALAHADSAAALALLAPDVTVLESGDVETFADYRSHHLAADIAFARAVPGVHTLVAVRIDGNTAWVTSTSVTRGQFERRSVNSAGAELMVLTRKAIGAPWMVRAIHWSSHRRLT